MASAERDSTKPTKTPTLAYRVGFLAFVGILTSAYLIYHHVSVTHGFQNEPSLCNLGGSFNCDIIARSKYSEIAGIPLASYGFVYYLLILGICMLRRPSAANTPDVHRGFGDALFLLAVLTLPPTLFLAGVSYFVIKAVCLFCTMQYLINLLLCLVTSRNGQRSSGTGASLRSGCRTLISYFSGFSAAGVLLWLLVLSGAAAAYVAPEALLEKVFKPRDAADVIEAIYQDWKLAPRVQIPVSSSEALLERDFSLGASRPSVTIVEFSDFECPYCKRASNHLKAIVAKHPERVRVVFKNYPLDASCNPSVVEGAHQLACQAALLARCAGLQGEELFWKMHDALFALEAAEWSVETLFMLPDEIGADNAQLNRCLEEPAAMERIKQDIAAGDAIAIQGTPTVYVDFKPVKIARFEQLEKLVDMILKKQ